MCAAVDAAAVDVHVSDDVVLVVVVDAYVDVFDAVAVCFWHLAVEDNLLIFPGF